MVILNEHETIEKLKEGYSIARYGDGEIAFILEFKGIGLMQDFSNQLRNLLTSTLIEPLDNLLVCIPKYNEDPPKRIKHLLSDNITYASAFVTRPSVVGNNNAEYYDLMKSIWRDKNIVLVNFNSDIVDHYLYRDSNIDYIGIPKRNCFEQYEEILGRCRSFYGQDKLFLLSAGPTATVMSYDITKDGEQCIDIGHITYEYSMFIGDKEPRSWVSQI